MGVNNGAIITTLTCAANRHNGPATYFINADDRGFFRRAAVAAGGHARARCAEWHFHDFSIRIFGIAEDGIGRSLPKPASNGAARRAAIFGLCCDDVRKTKKPEAFRPYSFADHEFTGIGETKKALP
ncbi:hypothetical protein [Cupriavidus respiraculi]|uniref:hypothetical protein n=1 Tax=Cupriavidus respiraculi TaxID=195930 RepID=UPI001CC6F2C5|nr:hypothetical protein [Cupriavidus respiraculi]